MENSNNSEIKQKYKRISSNRPIYKYKPISYYSNEIKKEESNSSGEEEEFSYSINDKKLEALKQKKRKIVENKGEDVKTIRYHFNSVDMEHSYDDILAKCDEILAMLDYVKEKLKKKKNQ
jgi:hypothetical protein